jgi:hypothetical protein
MIMSENADEILPNFGSMFTDEPLPDGGYVVVCMCWVGFALA